MNNPTYSTENQKGDTTSTIDSERQQQAAFIEWYESTGNSPNSTGTMSDAIKRAKLKNGKKAIFAINSYSELSTAIKNSGLEGYFDNRSGDYDKMNAVFDIEPGCRRDDLKSGIKYYLKFLKFHEPSAPNTPKEVAVNKPRYWVYAPGGKAKFWGEFYKKGIMGIGGDKIGDFTQYKTKDKIKEAMKDKYDASKSWNNVVHCYWQFAHEMKTGDVLFVKRGKSAIIGRGIVESGYIFDDERSEYKNIRKVKWTHKGEWEMPVKVAIKTLTDITMYTEDVETLEALFRGDEDEYEIDDAPEITYPAYSSDDFLKEVLT